MLPDPREAYIDAGPVPTTMKASGCTVTSRVITVGADQMTIRTTPIIRCPKCGSKSLTWPSQKNFACGSCGFVLYLNIASAVAVIMEYRDKILFGVRKHEPGRGMLDLPGGFVDPGETAEEAVRRELQEELNIEVPSMRYLFSFPNKYLYRGIEYDTLDLIFLVQCDELPEIQAADDLEDALWIRRDAIEYENIGFESLRLAVRRYLEIAQ